MDIKALLKNFFRKLGFYLSLVVFLSSLGGAVYGLFLLIRFTVAAFAVLPPTIFVAVITAAGTIFSSTLAVVVGRHWDRKKELQALHRDKKIPIYSEFVSGIFERFYGHSEYMEDNQNKEDATKPKKSEREWVEFFQDWQKDIVIWGGSTVVNTYIEWQRHIKYGVVNAQSLYLTEDLLRAIRKELGHKNTKLPKGTFVHFILRNPDLFLALSAKNPEMTLEDMAKIEDELVHTGNLP